jgi:enoyl-CoA hydratase/carnithine racemase
MHTDLILLDRSPTTITITLNRPGVYNAVSYDVLEHLDHAIAELEREPPRAVILTGSEPGFCSGVDLKESREATPDFAGRRVTLMHDVLRRLRRLPCPVIAAINGVAAGLGCELAISGDLRIASPDARFGYPEPRVAVPSPAHHLRYLIGVARTQDMLLTARWVHANEALTWGLVQRVAGQPLEAARELAGELTSLSPISLTRTKENLLVSLTTGEEAARQHHIEHVTAAAGTRDRAEALAAFAQKREPRFTGK